MKRRMEAGQDMDESAAKEGRAEVSTARPDAPTSNAEVSADVPGPSTSARAYSQLPFPHFARPEEVGAFSTGADKAFRFDRSQLKFLKLPPDAGRVRWELGQGMESYVADETQTFLGLILEWVAAEQGRSGRSFREVLRGADVLCWRGALTRIAATPYDSREGWKMAVVRFRGVLFLGEYKTAERVAADAAQTPRQEEMSYWGHKFETFLCADGEGRLDTAAPVDCHQCFCLVVRTKLDDLRLLYAGETDCQDPVSRDYLELKTTRRFDSARQTENFHRFKTVKWWLQCFLVGIPRILAGLRTDGGVVEELREWRTEELARMAAGWKGSVCLQFTKALLGHLRRTITEDDLDAVWLMERRPGAQSVSLRRLEGQEARDHTFLSNKSKDFLRNTS